MDGGRQYCQSSGQTWTFYTTGSVVNTSYLHQHFITKYLLITKSNIFTQSYEQCPRIRICKILSLGGERRNLIHTIVDKLFKSMLSGNRENILKTILGDYWLYSSNITRHSLSSQQWNLAQRY